MTNKGKGVDNKIMVFRKIGYGFMALGLIEIMVSRFSCKSFCQACTMVQIKPCFFLFLYLLIPPSFLANLCAFHVIFSIINVGKKSGKMYFFITTKKCKITPETDLTNGYFLLTLSERYKCRFYQQVIYKTQPF